MNFDFTEGEERFRKEVRGWLEANLPEDLRGKAFAASRADVDEVRRLRAWQKRMAEAGYVGMDWPREFGGRGAPITEMVILYQEMARAESPQLVNRGGVSMLGPTLMRYGTPGQQARFLPKILTGGSNGTTTSSVLVVNQLTRGANSASALSTITFVLIFVIAFGLVRLLNANLFGARAKAVS